MRRLLTLTLVIGLTACSAQLRGTTQDLSDSIATMRVTQVYRNLARFSEDSFAIPSHFILGEVKTSVSNTIEAGFDPAINFRGIGITGLALSGNNLSQSGWGLTPVADLVDLRRLQALYSYAVTGTPFATMSDRYRRVAAVTSPADNARERTRSEFPQNLIGTLPDGPIVSVDGSQGSCSENRTVDRIEGRVICFLGKPVATEPGGVALSPEEVRSRFILWVMAATQFDDDPQIPAASAGAPSPPRSSAASGSTPRTLGRVTRPPASPLRLPQVTIPSLR